MAQVRLQCPGVGAGPRTRMTTPLAYLVIATGTPAQPGELVQIQTHPD